MFRFEQSEYLWYLCVVPVLAAIYFVYWQWRIKQINSLGSKDLLHRLIPGWAEKRQHFKIVLILLSFFFLIIAYANPQWGNKKEKIKAKSSDVFIALDISQSMMAEDISPNRLERAKRLTQNIVQSLKGNRIGLIFFAGNAYLQMPLSNDYGAAQLFVSSANTNQATTQGTAISEAIDLALRAYEPEKNNQRGLIIITDGESHDDETIAKAVEAKEKGLNIFTIGVGTSEGAFVPYITQGRQQYKRDDDGYPVKSALNSELIEKLASSGGGESYFIGEGNSVINDLKNRIDLLQKEEVETRAFTDYKSYFQYFLLMGILFLLLEFVITERSTSKKVLS